MCTRHCALGLRSLRNATSVAHVDTVDRLPIAPLIMLESTVSSAPVLCRWTRTSRSAKSTRHAIMLARKVPSGSHDSTLHSPPARMQSHATYPANVCSEAITLSERNGAHTRPSCCQFYNHTVRKTKHTSRVYQPSQVNHDVKSTISQKLHQNCESI
jgi:hypothetical protein